MTEQSEASTVQAQIIDTDTEPVRDADAVLRKNKELLKKNSDLMAQLNELKPLAEKAKSFDFDAAQQALETARKSEEETLVKKGEFEKLLEKKSKTYEERLDAERREKELYQKQLKQEKLALALIEKGVLPDRIEWILPRYLDRVELAVTESGLQLQAVGGFSDGDVIDSLIEELRQKADFFIASKVTSGTGGSGTTGTASASARKWKDLTPVEKAQAIRDADGDVDSARKKFQ
jgi:hypothetical protein